MENIYINARGNFSQNEFINKIDKAIISLSKINDLSYDDFKKVIHSPSILFTINSESFQGQYITYEISKENIFIGHLDCFMDNKCTYIEIT